MSQKTSGGAPSVEVHIIPVRIVADLNETSEALRPRSGPHAGELAGKTYDEWVEQLYRIQFPKLFRFLDRMSGEPELATDLAQEAFIRLHRRGFPPDDPGAWLAAVAMNLFRNVKRSRGRRRRLLTVVLGEAVHGDAAASPDDLAFAGDQRSQVRMTLDRLSPRDGRLLLLRASGYSYREIAHVLELQEASVGTQLARARRAFRQVYEALFDAP